MTRQRHCRRLLPLLQQLCPVQRRLRNEGVIVVGSKHARRLQRPDDERDRLQLRPTLRDGLLVDREGLHGEFVRQFLEAGFVGGGEGEEVEPETDLGGFDLVVENRRALVDELEERRDLGFPVRDERLAVLVASRKLDGGNDEGRERPANPIAAFCELFPCRLKQLRSCERISSAPNSAQRNSP